jgi:membrane protein
LPGGAIDVVHDEITRITGQPTGTLGFAFLAGLAAALWSANGGMKAMLDALNVVYGRYETRGLLRLNATSLALVAGALLFLFVAILAVLALPAILHFLSVSELAKWAARILEWPLLFVVLLLALAALYRYGPDGPPRPWRWVSWGSAFASVAWIVASILFSWYAANFGSYNKTYGSLGAVIGFATWMWLSFIVVLVGAELDAVISGDAAPARDGPGGRRDLQAAPGPA